MTKKTARTRKSTKKTPSNETVLDRALRDNIYTVFRIDRRKKTVTVIGRELDIATAEKL